MMKDTVILDLDGTLCDVSHRIHLAAAKEWDAFHSLAKDDEPHTDVMTFVQEVFFGPMQIAGYRLIILTGRSDKFKGATQQWLSSHGVYPDEILMRPEKDFRPDHEVKLDLLEKHFGNLGAARDRVAFILDDRDSSVEGLRNAGFPVWQVRPSGY